MSFYIKYIGYLFQCSYIYYINYLFILTFLTILIISCSPTLVTLNSMSTQFLACLKTSCMLRKRLIIFWTIILCVWHCFPENFPNFTYTKSKSLPNLITHKFKKTYLFPIQVSQESLILYILFFSCTQLTHILNQLHIVLKPSF